MKNTEYHTNLNCKCCVFPPKSRALSCLATWVETRLVIFRNFSCRNWLKTLPSELFQKVFIVKFFVIVGTSELCRKFFPSNRRNLSKMFNISSRAFSYSSTQFFLLQKGGASFGFGCGLRWLLVGGYKKQNFSCRITILVSTNPTISPTSWCFKRNQRKSTSLTSLPI